MVVSVTVYYCMSSLSRSSTGVGEYHFKTTQSVQITHAIETVVKRLKYEALGSNQQVSVWIGLTIYDECALVAMT